MGAEMMCGMKGLEVWPRVSRLDQLFALFDGSASVEPNSHPLETGDMV